MITKILPKFVTLLAIAGALGTSSYAQDSSALLNVLVKKGILTTEEAVELREDLAADVQAAVTKNVSGGKSTRSLAISGRMQVQYAGIGSTALGKANTNHLFLRRMYFGGKASLGTGWSANLIYDFAGENFDKAYIEYASVMGDQPFAIHAGIRKVNFGVDEITSSGSLDAIERSGTTRYFVESNNGRRLGAGSYHVGVFYEGNPNARKQKTTGWFYGGAITNPERSVGVSLASGSGNQITNTQAFWAGFGYSGELSGESGGKYQLGFEAAQLPDQGGSRGAEGSDITVWSTYGKLSVGNFKLSGEFLAADVEDGAGFNKDASPWGGWVQGSYFTSDVLEFVGRYSYTNSDNRGIKVSDGVRSAPASFTGDTLTEYYLGLNYYFIGNDMKLQLGYVHGTANRGNASESADGLRSQLQVNF